MVGPPRQPPPSSPPSRELRDTNSRREVRVGGAKSPYGQPPRPDEDQSHPLGPAAEATRSPPHAEPTAPTHQPPSPPLRYLRGTNSRREDHEGGRRRHREGTIPGRRPTAGGRLGPQATGPPSSKACSRSRSTVTRPPTETISRRSRSRPNPDPPSCQRRSMPTWRRLVAWAGRINGSDLGTPPSSAAGPVAADGTGLSCPQFSSRSTIGGPAARRDVRVPRHAAEPRAFVAGRRS